MFSTDSGRAQGVHCIEFQSFGVGELGFLVPCWTCETSSVLAEDFVPDLY